MEEKSLHPDVRRFQQFVGSHPKLKQALRENKGSLQDWYEKWALLGEDDPFWDDYKREDAGDDKKEDLDESNDGSKKEWMNQFMHMVNTVNWDQVNGHIHQLNGAIGNIQNLVQQFQDMKKSNAGPKNTFPFLKD
ncbi:spore coat protein YlbD [Thalassobacillus hwangdonensis]|uniref:Spore coat protein YlbD n=1 Tax=Thalassobacillus hwangdonensis TaxID=546108 RepID=A0ABW3KVY5_9BACI